jgi:quercetin dioxygenase-like cupin family protein
MQHKPPYRLSFEKEVPEVRVTPQRSKTDLMMRMIFGSDTSFMLATRDPGYHTKPHLHDAEQINYIVAGELWIFVEENGYRCVKGDLMRIPRNKVHWAWNRGSGPCVMLESHTPPLIGDEQLRRAATPMLGPDEDAELVQGVRNIHVDINGLDEIERRAIAEPAEIDRRP